MLRFLRYICEIVAGFVAVSILLGLLLAWRLSTTPVSSEFITPYIETAVAELIPDGHVHIDSTLLEWDSQERAIAIHVKDITVQDSDGDVIADVPKLDAKLSAIALAFGQFMPTDLAITEPQLKIIHDAQGAYLFGGSAVGGQSGKTDSHSSIGTVLQNVAAHLAHAKLMHKLAVTDAQIDIHDEALKKDWTVNVPEISVTRGSLGTAEHPLDPGALEGRMTVGVTQKDTEATLDIHYDYDPLKESYGVAATFGDLTPAFFAGGHPENLGFGAASMINLPLTGNIQASFDKNFAIAKASGHIHGGQGQIIVPDMWDKPLPVKNFDFNADYDGKKQILSVSDTQLDVNGPVIGLEVTGAKSATAGQDMDFAATLTVDALPMNRYDELWPKPILPDPRYWLAVNLRNGIFNHAEATLKGSFNWANPGNVNVTDGGGRLAASGATVTYLDGLPPAQNVNANATFDLKTMHVQITSGGIGNIRMSPFMIEITGLADVDQYIDLPLQVSGPIPEVLSLLDNKPLGYARKLGIAPDELSGQISGQVRFQLPLLKTLEMKDLKITADARATNVASAKLIPGLAVDQGDLVLSLNMDGFHFKGPANLDKVPFQIDWQENFAAQKGVLRKATVTGIVREDQWANFGVSLFNGTKGPIALSLDMTRTAKDKTIYASNVDMGQAAVNVDLLGWKKPAGAPAALKFNMTQITGKPVDITGISLRGPQIMANGDAKMSADLTQILSVNLTPLNVGRTNASIHFSQTFGEDGAVHFAADGQSLDLGGMRGGQDPAPADMRSQDFKLSLAKLYVGNVGEFDQMQGSASRDKNGWRQISLHGLAENDTEFNLELTPQPSGFSTLKVSCDNFGEAMKALGFTDQIKGGRLNVSGQSTVDAPRVIVGNLKVSDFTVQKLPAFALLLNATSPFAFKGILTDSADFSKLKGEFRWQGDDITLTKMHAAGSAVGINIDGKINMNSGEARLNGTLVPFSTVNNILNAIPIIGDLLTGGENQGVLAVAYQISGNLSSPDVSVNPVSLLTPGFIRNLFFGGDDSNDEEQ